MTYQNFIQNIIDTRGRFACNGYKERHHIIPKSMGGSNDENNLIDLYAQEHFIAHKLLALENPDERKLVYAWWRMSHKRAKNNKVEIEVTADDYALSRELFVNHMKHRIVTKETRKKLSDINRGKNNAMYGKCGEQNPCYGRKHTQEERQRMKNNHVDVSGINNPMYGLRGSKSPHAKSCYCIELDTVYGSLVEAEELTGVHRQSISGCLRGVRQSAGKHPITSERLHWRWV